MDQRIELGFRLCTARPPDESETALLRELFEAERAHFQGELDAARALAAPPGLPLGTDEASLDVAELAAWTVVANALLNLDETITKG